MQNLTPKKSVFAWIGFSCVAILAGCNRGGDSTEFTAADGTVVTSPTTMPVGNSPPRSMASFKNALVVGLTTTNINVIQKLVYPDRVTMEHQTRLKEMAEMGMGRPITGVTEESLDSLGKSATLSGTVNGVRYEANLKHLGFIRVAFHTESSKVSTQASGINFPYGIKDGAYYIVNSVRVK